MIKNIFTHLFLIVLVITFVNTLLFASDWPVYKGNIYFTGNNDEVSVKNNNLKWLFQASEIVYNPIVSDDKVYFLDFKKNVYCLNEHNGKLLWKVDLKIISSQFYAKSRTSGKVKYPLIKGNKLFLTDNIAMFCLNKNSGKVIWARTGMRGERKLSEFNKWNTDQTNKWQPGIGNKWQPQMNTKAIVDYIYSNPVIYENLIYYGTRNVFISREITNGHLMWNNESIKSYSGFPTLYDKYVFTQSMDYSTNEFSLYCLNADNGSVRWIKKMNRPHKIFSPVVYKQKIYLAFGKEIYCIDIKTGRTLWIKEYFDFITSNPAFTERSIVFTVGNRKVVMIDPIKGSILKSINFPKKSSPYFVIIRDHIYIANTFKKKVGDRMLSYASLKGFNFDNKKLWEFVSPFPGGSYQPVASNGIMFLPAGNYLYAVGTDYYPRIIEGGSSHYDPYMKKLPEEDQNKKIERVIPKKKESEKKKTIKLRKMNITIKDKNNMNVPAIVEIKKWDRGKIIYSKKIKVTKKNSIIQVPDMNDVEVTASSDGYIPKKVIVSKKDKEKVINLDKIEKGEKIVVDNIYFEINEAFLRKESLNILDSMIESMKRNKRIKIKVQGHTDSTGEKNYNQKLSERRADAVIEYMIKNGISPERLYSVGFGLKNPIASNKTPEGRRKNRRTEFLILDK